MAKMNYNLIADSLDKAAMYATPIAQVSGQNPINLDEAYAIQSISLAKRYVRGEKFLGIKLGFTSKAKMEQMGVHDMIWGRLTDRMLYMQNEELDIQDFIHPRAEPEIAFRLSQDVDCILDESNAMDYIDGVAVAIEIIDSRYENFKFSLEDVVADNCSSAGFIIGEWQPKDTPVANLEMKLIIDNETVESGNSNAILGNPMESLYAASRLALENGEQLLEGHVILAGAATSAIYIKEGQLVKAEASGLGSVELQIGNE
ncbi:MAG: fumarylacetoacetate hydrolase family protein [Bacteroidia bacterium]|nr:fumarylacetoacetate hydrolase family protein [Bacteroidia bacterium]